MITIKARHWTLSLLASQALLLGVAQAAALPGNEAPPPWTTRPQPQDDTPTQTAATVKSGAPVIKPDETPEAAEESARTPAVESAREDDTASGSNAPGVETWYRNRRLQVAQARPETNVTQWLAAAEKGDAHAQYALALHYRDEERGRVDTGKSLDWQKRAADAGYAEAQYGLGVLYANGQYVKQDRNQARQWFEKAAAQGHEVARLALASLLEGAGAAAMPDAPLAAPERPAAMASATPPASPVRVTPPAKVAARPAAPAVSVPPVQPPVLKPAPAPSAPVVEEAPQPVVMADPVEEPAGEADALPSLEGIDAETVRQSAENGDPQAQLLLGTLYEDGLAGLPADLRQAASWYEQAARQGYAKAQYNLGLLYEDGRGVEQDLAKAAHWYNEAARTGFAEAQNNLGLLYVLGKGVGKNPARAESLFKQAAAQGNANAQRNLSMLKGG